MTDTSPPKSSISSNSSNSTITRLSPMHKRHKSCIDELVSKKKSQIQWTNELSIKLCDLWIRKGAHIGKQKGAKVLKVNEMFFNKEHNSLMTDAIYAHYCEKDARKLSDKVAKLCINMKTRDNQNTSGLEGSPGELQKLVNTINREVEEEKANKLKQKISVEEEQANLERRNDEMLGLGATKGAVGQNQGFGIIDPFTGESMVHPTRKMSPATTPFQQMLLTSISSRSGVSNDATYVIV